MGLREVAFLPLYSPQDDPLNNFYVPALSHASRYDRVAGYFSSSTLAIAAAGVSRFIAGGGTMRLIVGADLQPHDVAAITAGQPLEQRVAQQMLADPLVGQDLVERRRLEVLAWLVAEGRLQIRVGVPLDYEGQPLPRAQTKQYFHSKYGVFYDSFGDRIAFIGSDNESAGGWRDNHETFSAFPSWETPVWNHGGQPIVERFDKYWAGHPDTGWAIVDLPDAIRDELIGLAPAEPPAARDPAEPVPAGRRDTPPVDLSILVTAPRDEPGGVGIATANVTPWPHQRSIAHKVVEQFPRSFLFGDEVGLGKTIETGLVIRELLVSGRADRILLLVPAGVAPQWQGELADRFALDVPRYDGKAYFDASGCELAAPSGNPWAAFPVLLSSSHLARRSDRRVQLLEAAPWDVVFVDEAHHARRRGSKPTATMNTLLRLLWDLKERDGWRALYLASATPMQMYAHEAWDLLSLLGLSGRWAKSAEAFEGYFRQLRLPFEERNLRQLQIMLGDYFGDPAARRAESLEKGLKRELGLVKSRVITRLHQQPYNREALLALKGSEREALDRWLREHTPMRDRVFRTTRSTLKRYRDEHRPGFERLVIPERHVDDAFVQMTDSERLLYRRVENYISRHYNRYLEEKRKALGFIMTVYRRRLTSSFAAIERSLLRRQHALKEGHLGDLLDEDDIAALETSALVDVGELTQGGRDLVAELREVEEFLSLLANRPPDESKMRRLDDDLQRAFAAGHSSVLVFTQYTDTMDYLRDRLVNTYGETVGTYSGRGGEVYRNGSWQTVDRGTIKRMFRQADGGLRVLIGTDALSEGLNLQTCARLVNYDMPWNFMRVEQRIGRIDRIGGRPRIYVSNYFYKDTVEEAIYHGISEDFDWFTDIVGPAQAVLGQVEDFIENAAMAASDEDRAAAAEQAAADLRAGVEAAQERPLTLETMATEFDEEVIPPPPLTLGDVQRLLTTAPAVADRFRQHETVAGAWWLTLRDRCVPVTFDRDVAEELGFPLLTYFTPEFDELLEDFLGLDAAPVLGRTRVRVPAPGGARAVVG